MYIIGQQVSSWFGIHMINGLVHAKSHNNKFGLILLIRRQLCMCVYIPPDGSCVALVNIVLQ